MSVVEVRGASKYYGELGAMVDVQITFGEGEFFGLLGPSGSGKTTLLRTIAGFIEPDKGQILIDGKDVSAVPVHRRDIGMVFQNYALFPHMSVFDNIAFGLSVRGVAAKDAGPRVAEMLALVRLSGLEERRPRQLSGGQQQRVALARSLITRPRVLLLDEPLGALDKRLRQEMQVELKQIQREVGITTIFVTHDQEEALTLSDRVAILNEGRVVQVGTPSEVYERPNSAFTANFLGDANLLTGPVTAGPNGLGAIDWHGERILTADKLASGGQATLAVRPEKFRIEAAEVAPADSGEGPPRNRLRATITRAVYSGNATTYRASAAGGELTVFAQNRTARLYAIGAAVTLVWSPEHTVPVA